MSTTDQSYEPQEQGLVEYNAFAGFTIVDVWLSARNLYKIPSAVLASESWFIVMGISIFDDLSGLALRTFC